MNDEISKKLQRLDDFLTSDAVDEDAMLLSELDGFLAGVIVCPDMVPPSEWLPNVWGELEPDFESPQQARMIHGLIMEHYNGLIRDLNRGRYRPIYDIDTDDSYLWEIWMEGFKSAMDLRPDTWSDLAERADKKTREALFILHRLTLLGSHVGEYEPLDLDEQLRNSAAHVIGAEIKTLHRAKLAHDALFGGPTSNPSINVGRNDPCPCGSGKKFKKCCLD